MYLIKHKPWYLLNHNHIPLSFKGSHRHQKRRPWKSSSSLTQQEVVQRLEIVYHFELHQDKTNTFVRTISGKGPNHHLSVFIQMHWKTTRQWCNAFIFIWSLSYISKCIKQNTLSRCNRFLHNAIRLHLYHYKKDILT